MIGQYVTVHGDVVSHVNISHVMVEDGGEYSCIAENRAGKTLHSARLNVYGKEMKRDFYYISPMPTFVHTIFTPRQPLDTFTLNF